MAACSGFDFNLGSPKQGSWFRKSPQNEEMVATLKQEGLDDEHKKVVGDKVAAMPYTAQYTAPYNAGKLAVYDVGADFSPSRTTRTS